MQACMQALLSHVNKHTNALPLLRRLPMCAVYLYAMAMGAG